MCLMGFLFGVACAGDGVWGSDACVFSSLFLYVFSAI